MDSDSRRFIQKLSEVRNHLVHEVSNVDIELKSFFSSVKEEERKGFFKAFRWGYSDKEAVKYKVSNEHFDLHEVLKYLAIVTLEHVPKIAIWLGSIIVLRQIYSNVAEKKFIAMKRQIDEEIIELLEKVEQEREKHPEDQPRNITSGSS